MKKLLLIALAALSFGSASAYKQADGTWKWQGMDAPAQTVDASIDCYIMNAQTGQFLVNGSTTLVSDNADDVCAAGLFNVCYCPSDLVYTTGGIWKDSYGFIEDGYIISYNNGGSKKYLAWAGSGAIITAIDYPLDPAKDEPHSKVEGLGWGVTKHAYATYQMEGDKETGYNIWFASASRLIKSGLHYIFVNEDAPSTLVKSNKADEKSSFAHWRFISKDEMDAYHTYLEENDVLNLYKTTLGSDIKNNHEYTNIYVHRALKAGYNTIALPFDVADVEAAFGEGAYVSKFTGAEEVDGASYTLTFTKQNNIEANVPYILHLNAATPEVLTFENTKAVSEVSESATFAGWTFQSNYLPNQPMKDKYGVVNSTAKIMRGTETATINGLTAYFTFNGTALNSVQAIFVDGQETLTDIQQLEPIATGNGQTIYTISGQRVNNAVNGINIINGRKVLKK